MPELNSCMQEGDVIYSAFGRDNLNNRDTVEYDNG